MKKIFILILIICFCKTSFSQYTQQNLGSNTTLISLGNANGGAIKGNLINTSYSDTTAANLQRIRQYAGGQIFTTGDTSLWLRSIGANKWVKLAGAAGAINIYNSDGTLTGNRNLYINNNEFSFYSNGIASGKVLFFSPERNYIGSPNSTRQLLFYPDSVLFVNTDVSSSSSDSVLVRTSTGRLKTRAQSALTVPISSITNALANNTVTGASRAYSFQLSDFSDLHFQAGSGAPGNEIDFEDGSGNMGIIANNGSLTLNATNDIYIKQNLFGSNIANGDLRIGGTSNATKTTSYVTLQEDGGLVGIGTSTPDSLLHNAGSFHQVGNARFDGLSDFADTTNFKPVVINTTGTAGVTNRLYKATYWPGGGGSSDTLPYSTNPSAWVTQKSPNNPVINSDMYTPNPVTEHTQYAPSPIIAWDGNVWNYVKGDGFNLISVYKSTDRGESFTFIDSVIVPRASTYYSESATIPGAVADSANNLIHIYFQALATGVTPDVFAIGKSTAPFNDPSNVTVSSTPLITPADFVTQTGVLYQPGYLNITSVVKTDSIYFFGTFWDGNADNPSGDFKLFMGSSVNYDTIRNCRVILSPTAPYDLVRSPSVFSDNGLYKMIYTNGYIDNDSLTNLVSAYSSDLKTWTLYPGVLLDTGMAGSWEEKRVYMAQVLKKSTGTFAEPYFFPTENYGYPQNDNYTDAIKYYYSGSNFDAPPYHDFTGLGYLYPQRGRDDFFISENDTNVSVINRNTTHVINIPNATDTTTGKLKAVDWVNFNSKAPGSGSANYIQNKSATTTAQTSSSFSISDSAHIGKVLMVGGNATSLYTLNVNANTGTGNYAGQRIYNSAISNKDFYWQVSTAGELAHGGNGTSGAYTLSSFATGMLWQSTYWRWREVQSPFNYIFEIDGTASANAVNIVPSAGKAAIGGYTKDSTLTVTGSARVSTNLKVGGKIASNQGADVASANNIVVVSNSVEITGATQINLIANTGWANGSVIHLIFTSTPTIKNGQTTSGSNITILLAGAADFVASADDILTLMLCEVGGTQAWREISRSIN